METIINNSRFKIVIIFIFALIIRLIYIYYVVPVDWVGDSYHHWQIALYTLKIGISQGRMWDLKGVEYYWPPLPTLLEAALMEVFRNTSINLMRFFNSIFGSLSVIFAYFMGLRYNKEVGITITSVLLFFPFTLNTEVLALHEPLMGFFFLMGLYFFIKEKRFYAGILFGLSYLCHFSVYLTVPLILATIILKEREVDAFLPFISGFFLVYIPYMFFLKTQTGDPLYNIRSMITYMGISTANMRHPVANIMGYILIPLGAALLYWKLRRGANSVESIINLVLLGGYMLFWGNMYLFVGAPLSPYEMRYYWIPIVLGIINLSELTYSIDYLKKYFWGLPRISLFCILISFSLLFTLSPFFSELQEPIKWDFWAADNIGENYDNGTIISPVPHMTYRLINDWKILPQNILGPIYCPVDQLEKIQWLKSNNVTIIFWLPGMEADRVFPELSRGLDVPPLFILKKLGYDRYIYAFHVD